MFFSAKKNIPEFSNQWIMCFYYAIDDTVTTGANQLNPWFLVKMVGQTFHCGNWYQIDSSRIIYLLLKNSALTILPYPEVSIFSKFGYKCKKIILN